MQHDAAATVHGYTARDNGPARFWLIGISALSLSLLAGGCRTKPSGTFQLDLSPREKLTRHLAVDAGWSTVDERDQVQAIFVSRPEPGRDDAGERILIIRTFWRTRAARTPDTQAATNANIEYVVHRGGRSAWYRGAGYAEADVNKQGDVRLELFSAQLRLHAADEGFTPSFTDANLSGSAAAQGSRAGAEQVLERFRAYTEGLRN